MDITEGIADEQVDISGGHEDIRNETDHEFAAVASPAIEYQRYDLREHDDHHSGDSKIANQGVVNSRVI